MLMTRESKKDLARLQADLETACTEHRFGVLGIHDIRAKLKEKGQPYDRACLVYEVCNPAAAREVLDANPEISTALPCRIALYEGKDGRTRLATLRPTMLLELFGTPGLQDTAHEVERSLDAILRDAAG